MGAMARLRHWSLRVVAVALLTSCTFALADVTGTPYWWNAAITSTPCTNNATAVSEDGMVFVATCASGGVGVSGFTLASGASNWTASNVFNTSDVEFVGLAPLASSAAPGLVLVLGSTAVAALDPWSGAVVRVFWLPSWSAPPLLGLASSSSPPGNLVSLFTATSVFALNTTEVATVPSSAAFKPFFNLTAPSETIAFQPILTAQPDAAVVFTSSRRAFAVPLPNTTAGPLTSYSSASAGYFAYAANTTGLSIPPVLYKDVLLLGGTDGYLGWFTYGEVLSLPAANASHMALAGASNRSAIRSVCVTMSALTSSAFTVAAVWGATVGLFDMFDGGAVQHVDIPGISPSDALSIVSVPRSDTAVATSFVLVNDSAFVFVVAAGTGSLVANLSMAPYASTPLRAAHPLSNAPSVYLLFPTALVELNATTSGMMAATDRVPVVASGFTDGSSLSAFTSSQPGVVFVTNDSTLEAVSTTAFPTPVPPPTTVAPTSSTPAPTPIPTNGTATPAPNTTSAPSTAAPTPAPTNVTAAPPNATEAPGNETAAPGDMTAAPGNTTAAPGNVTASPGNATEAPSNATTVAPSNSTEAPGNGTSAPANVTAAPSNATMAPANATMAPTNVTMAPTNAAGVLFSVVTANDLNVSGRVAFAQQLVAAVNGTAAEIELEFSVGDIVEFAFVGVRADMLAAALEAFTPSQLLALGIVSITRGTFAPSGAPSNTTSAPPSPAPQTGAPSSAAPSTPQPTSPITTYTATFNRSLTMAEKNVVVAAIAALLHLNSINDIQLLPSADNAVVFRFTGSNASALTAAFDALSDTEKQSAMGYTTLSAATDAPATPPDNGLDEQSKVIIIVCATVGGILVIGVIGYCVVSSKRKGHVPFDEYVQMDNQERLDVPVNYRPESGTSYGSYRV